MACAARRARASASSRLVARSRGSRRPGRRRGAAGRSASPGGGRSAPTRRPRPPRLRRYPRPPRAPLGRDEEDARTPRRRGAARLQRLRSTRICSPSADESARLVQVDAERGAGRARHRGRRRAARRPRPRTAPVRAEPDLGVARPVLDPERRRPRRARLDRPASSAWRARPGVSERDAEGRRLGGHRSVTVSGMKPPSTRERRSRSARARRSAPRRARRRREASTAPRDRGRELRPRRATSVSPRWPCRSGALTTHGNRAVAGSLAEHARGCGTPAAAKRSRCRVFDVASTAVAPSIGCGSPSRSATRAAIPTGQSMPGAMIPSTLLGRASRSIARLVLGRDHRASSASAKPGASGSRSTAITNEVRARARPRAGRAAPAPAPRTRRRCAVGARGLLRHQASLSRYQAMVCSSPSSNARARPPAGQALHLVGGADVAVDLAEPLRDVRLQSTRLRRAPRARDRRSRPPRCRRRWRR